METNIVLINNGIGNSHTDAENPLSTTLQKAQQGDQEAFSDLYNLYFEKIYSFVYYRVSHKEVAEDIAEEVFLKAYQQITGLKEPGAFEGWLYQIARNKVIDYYRAKKIVVPLDQIENTVIYENTIIDILELEAQQKIFLELLKELAPEQQSVIRLKFFEQLENQTIAALLKKSEGAIRVIQHRALNRLKELLNKNRPD